MFEDSERQTHTATESAFRAGMVSMAGNLTRILQVIGLAVIFTILVVTANTMSMAVRQRRKEVAVLKTLGFGSGLVMALILGEALVLGAARAEASGSRSARSRFGRSGTCPSSAGRCSTTRTWASRRRGRGRLRAGAAAEPVAGLVPATIAYRGKVTDLLRTV